MQKLHDKSAGSHFLARRMNVKKVSMTAEEEVAVATAELACAAWLAEVIRAFNACAYEHQMQLPGTNDLL